MLPKNLILFLAPGDISSSDRHEREDLDPVRRRQVEIDPRILHPALHRDGQKVKRVSNLRPGVDVRHAGRKSPQALQRNRLRRYTRKYGCCNRVLYLRCDLICKYF